MRRLESRVFEKPHDPSLDRGSQLDLSAVDELHNSDKRIPALPATVDQNTG
jgi:hypothetical protein